MKRPRREPIVLSQMRPATLFFVLSGCIVLTIGLLNFNSLVTFFRKIMSALGPVLAGFVIAYLLNPAVNWLEKRLSKWFAKPIAKHESLKNFPRAFSAFFSVLLFIGTVVLLVAATSSQVATGLSTAIQKLPVYTAQLTEKAEKLLSDDNILSEYLNRLNENFSGTTLGTDKVDPVDLSQKILSVLATGAVSTLGFIYSVVVGFIIAVYLLASKERFIKQFKQILYAVCKPKTARWLDSQMTAANETFGTAVLGKMIDSVLIGIFCFIGCTCLQMPYTALIAVIIGMTNIIPYFGPIFGAIPCLLLVLMENPMKALYLLVFIVALQQFDANILDPRIVGQSIGLPAFWELFACMLGAGLFGMVGLILGVPAFAVLYSVIRQLVTERLNDRVQDGELESEFVRDTLGVTEPVEESGLLDDDDSDSPYVQHLILLEDIAEQPKQS